MFRSIIVLYICCVGLSVARELPQVEKSQDVLRRDIQEPQVVTNNNCSVTEQWSHCTNIKCPFKNCPQTGLPPPCPILSPCKPGCECIDGYMRDKSGLCVLKEDCSTNKTCPLYEQWYSCSNAVCKAEHCSNRGWPVVCPQVYQCIPGCLCQDEYLRDESGHCVPEKDCKEPYCGPNQVHTDCKRSRLNENYSAMKNPSNCDNEVSEPWKPGCICRDGYFRVEKDRPCVPRCDCSEMQDAQDCLELEDEYE